MTDHLSALSISVVFITYDRLITLEPTVLSFLAETNYPREQLHLVVSDDCSPPAVQQALKELPVDQLRLGKRRSGLGANANAALALTSGEYVLQLQDDWECVGPPDYLLRAASALLENPEIGMILLNEHPNSLPPRKVVCSSVGNIRIYENDPSRPVRRVGEHAYSDWPHLKRQDFIAVIGPYLESPQMWKTELEFSQRVNAQTRYFVADIAGMTAFRHIGAEHSYNWPWKKRAVNVLFRFPMGPFMFRGYRRLRNALFAGWRS